MIFYGQSLVVVGFICQTVQILLPMAFEPTVMPQMVMKCEEIKGSRDMDIKSCMYI